MHINRKNYTAYYSYRIKKEEVISKCEKIAKSLYRRNFSEITDTSKIDIINKKVMDDLANERANNKIFLNIQETGHGQYMIVMFYLNMNNLNQATGEDL